MKNKKKLWVIIVALMLLFIGVAIFLGRALGKQEVFLVTLNERDVTMEIGETLQLQILPIDEEDKLPQYNMEWKSSNPKVATVDDNGLITAIATGETKITALITTGEQEYSASCVITILGDEDEQATYTIKYFVQEKDRDGYQVTEESYTRLIGREVVIEKSYALSKVPSKNYVFNEEKSNLKGTVKKNKGLILELYYDVAEITYTVNAYYETAELGMYLKESQKLKAYAFTEVSAPDLTKTGYAFKKNAAGTVSTLKQVQAGSQLSVYYNRVRANVTIAYVSGKPSVTYQCVYGVGIKDVPDSVFQDTFEPYYVAPYVNGQKITSVKDFLKGVTKDTTIEYRVDTEGFEYSSANGGTLTNKTTKARTAAYTYLNGKDSTIYLSATYNLTGYTDNLFGVELKSGGTTREIRFSEYGVSVMKDHTKESGIIGKKENAFNYASAQQGEYAWAQNMKGNASSKRISVIKTMTSNMDASKHKVVWAVWEGTLYAQVDGQMCVRLPLTLLDKSWTADAEYEIALSTWDKYSYGDKLSIADIKVDFGEEAESKLVLNKQITNGVTQKVHYEPITGSYLPESYGGASYIYSEETIGDVAVSATVSAVDIDNTVSNVGVSVMVNGDVKQSVQVMVENNKTARRTTGHTYSTRVNLPTNALLGYEKPYKNGECELVGAVKNGNLYVLFNGKQVYTLPLEAFLDNYNAAKDKIAIGITTNDATLGLYQYEDLSFVSGDSVANIATEAWGMVAETHTGNKYSNPTINSKESSIIIPTNGEKGSYAVVNFIGSSRTWEVSGTVSSDTTVLMKHGLLIESGSKKIAVLPKWFNTEKGGGIWLNGNATNNGWKEVSSLNLFRKDITGIFNDGNAKNDNNVAGIQEDVYKSFQEKNKDKVNFKYQLVDDVLYAWFCAANVDIDSYATAANYAWKIDLTDSELGGFEARSKYTVGLRVTNSAAGATGNSITENLKVKVGSQVDKTISQAIKANYWPFNLNYNVVNKQAVNERQTSRFSPTQSSIIYYPGRSNTVWTSANVTYRKVGQDKTPLFGITVATTDGKNAQLCIRAAEVNKGGLFIYKDYLGSAHSAKDTYATVGHYNSGVEVFADCAVSGINGSYAYALRTPDDGETWNIKAAIYNNTLYISLDGVLLYAIPMTALYTEWTVGTQYAIGYASQSGKDRGYMDLSDMEVYFGEKAEEQFILPSGIQNMQDSHLMTYNLLDGTYVPSNASGYAYTYGHKYDQTDTIAMRTTVTERIQTSGTVKAGIALKLGDTYRYIMNDAEGYGEIAITRTNPLTLSAIVRDKKLYIWDDSTNVPVYEQTLRDIFGEDYDKDAKIQIGFVAKDSDKVAEIFRDTKFYTGVHAENVYAAMKDGTAIQEITE